MGRRHRLIVEFGSAKEMERFVAEVKQCGGVATAIGVRGHRFTVTEYKPGTTNTISGNTTGAVIQADRIDGGVVFP